MSNRIIFGRYELKNVMGEAGMASVYEGKDLQLDTNIVVKILTTNIHDIHSEKGKRFTSEIALLQTLKHPGIVEIFDSGIDKEELFYIMEHVPGLSLSKCEKISTTKLIKIFIDIAEVIGYLHSRGIVHRDIKPANIIVLPEINASGKHAKLLDFGLARFSEDSRITSAGMVVGTMSYLAPEQLLHGEVDTRSDLYSFGVTMFKIFTGNYPYDSNNIEDLAYKLLEGSIPSASSKSSSIPGKLSNLIGSLLRRDPSLRPQSMEEVISILRELTSSFAITSSEDSIKLQTPALTGREWEFRNILQCWENPELDNIHLISGPFGIGKSRLLDEFASRLLIYQLPVLRARGNTSSTPSVGAGLIQLAFDLSNTREEIISIKHSDKEISKARDRIISNTKLSKKIKFVSELKEDFKLFFSNISSRVAILLDDIQMLDETTIEVITSSAQTNKNLFVLMSVDNSKNMNFFNKSSLKKYTLEPLEGLIFSQLIQRVLGTIDIPSELYSDVINNAKGNPLFALEYLRHLIETNCIKIVHNKFSYRQNTSELNKFISQRVTGNAVLGLSENAKSILEFSIIHDDYFSNNDIMQCLNYSREQSIEGIIHLRDRQLLSKTQRGKFTLYNFNNNFLRKPLLARIDTRKRKYLYSQIAKFYLHSKVLYPDDYFKIAMHFIEAGMVEKSLPIFIHYLWHVIIFHRIKRDRILSKLDKIAEVADYSVWQFIVDIIDACFFYRNGDHKEAYKTLEKINTGNNIQGLLARFLQARFNYRSGEVDTAIEILESILSVSENSETIDGFKAMLYAILSKFQRSNFELKLAILSINKAIDCSQKSDLFMLVDARKIKIGILIDLLDMGSAEVIVNQSIANALENNNNETYLWFRRILAIIEHSKGKLETSKNILADVISSSDNRQGLGILTKAHYIRAEYYLGNWDNALKIADENVSTKDHACSFSTILIDFFKIIIKVSRGDIQSSTQDAARLLTHSKNIQYLPGKILSLLASGCTSNLTGQTKKTNEYFTQAWGKTVLTNQPGLIIDTCFHILNTTSYVIADDMIAEMYKTMDGFKPDEFPFHYQQSYRFCIAVLACHNSRVKIKTILNSINTLQEAYQKTNIKNIIFKAYTLVQSAKLFFLKYKITKNKEDLGVSDNMFFEAEFIWRVLGADEELEHIKKLRDEYMN